MLYPFPTQTVCNRKPIIWLLSFLLISSYLCVRASFKMCTRNHHFHRWLRLLCQIWVVYSNFNCNSRQPVIDHELHEVLAEGITWGHVYYDHPHRQVYYRPHHHHHHVSPLTAQIITTAAGNLGALSTKRFGIDLLDTINLEKLETNLPSFFIFIKCTI